MTTEREPTVEECLIELKRLFPGKPVTVRRECSFYPANCRDPPETVKAAIIKIGYLESDPEFRANNGSLSGAMAQVRQWHRDNKQ